MAFPGDVSREFTAQKVIAAGLDGFRIESGQLCERSFKIELMQIVLQKT